VQEVAEAEEEAKRVGMQRDSAAERREKLRYALESWDPSLRRSSGPIVCSPTASPSRPQRIMGARATRDKGDLNDSSLSQHSLSSSAASSSRFDGQLNPADLCSALDEMVAIICLACVWCCLLFHFLMAHRRP
jgi:hypothetical protein